MVSISRRYVTLLELLIVIAILALVGGLVSIGINRALSEQRFRTEVSLIVDQLRLAQDLMLILGTDVSVVFTAKKGDKNSEGLQSGLELETTISPGIEREVLRKHSNLKTVKSVGFKDPGSKPGQIAIKFQSKGAVMSTGLMSLATTDADPPPEGTLLTYICLPGYPRHIYSEDDFEKANTECNAAIESANDLALTQDTFSKIPELLKEGKEPEADEGKKKDSKQEQSPGSKKASANKPSVAK